MIQKFNQDLSLHHSIIVLNYATLATISSLAIAPKVPVWRGFVQKDRTDPLQKTSNDQATQGRIVLAIALIVQVCLQWAFAVILFVNPIYSQEKVSRVSGCAIIV